MVDDHQVDIIVDKLLFRLLRIPRLQRDVATANENNAKGVKGGHVVVDNEDSSHYSLRSGVTKP
jgi:hypothetical protein